MSNMLLKAALIIVILSYKVELHPFTKHVLPDTKGAHLQIPLMEGHEEKAPVWKFKGPGSGPTPHPSLKLPESQRILASDINNDLFRPEGNRRPVTDLLKSILLPPTSPPRTSSPASAASRPVDMLCHIDRIYVRVLKSLFTNPDAWKFLKVGTCAVNEAKGDHYYFLYYLNSCNVKRQENENEVIYSNTLNYEPASAEPVIRELPFSVQLECHYSKHHRSYHVGFMPEMAEETIFWGLKTGISLTPVDVSWKPVPSMHSYVVGQPMYFEAKAPRSQDGKRLYLNNCYITSSPTLTSTPKYTVLDNYGCMVDSKKTPQTRFHASADKNTLRFSVGALVFKDMMSQPAPKKVMFLHCEMSLGPETATPSAKSCSYNEKTKRWSELYGDHSVCACCDATCPASEPSVTMEKITSSPLELGYKDISLQSLQTSFGLQENVDMFGLYGFSE